ncbi:ribosomal protein S15 precursor-like protein [Annulohypoxylon maeteangense]|uniref:ribosomal protein S15 precursor-like protein n=1 Tax=Annulohypoxylon maeteangense TaxID=1927788 RepID=UPI002007B778|nr:ribosomal protein S15 precursor-like protein [Annulohypoxylon maeteangense]KAI0884588.1 ribosomal protein S15 precursor-like protein [Annulohypoxylon maeteangense]
MPPRIPGVQRLGTFSLCLRPAVKQPTSSFLPVTQTASLSQKDKKRIAKLDPYRYAQIQQREAAHSKRREELDAIKASQLGDPVRGIQTPFIESFDFAGQQAYAKASLDADGNPVAEPHELPTSHHILNNQIDERELTSAIENAYNLTRPMGSPMVPVGSDEYNDTVKKHEQLHDKAMEAIRRITHLSSGSAKDRLHANIRRCVETFGRHETDQFLKPKALARGEERKEMPVRGGPDTGSSEVQIAILTAKIRGLANALEKGKAWKDKVGKRDLRLLLHRRQRLMRYMERKERGSDRWKHMIETLGLSPATWKGQITL